MIFELLVMSVVPVVLVTGPSAGVSAGRVSLGRLWPTWRHTGAPPPVTDTAAHRLGSGRVGVTCGDGPGAVAGRDERHTPESDAVPYAHRVSDSDWVPLRPPPGFKYPQ